MEFRIADTFTDSLARLTGDEQKAVKTTVFDLQMNPANPEAFEPGSLYINFAAHGVMQLAQRLVLARRA